MFQSASETAEAAAGIVPKLLSPCVCCAVQLFWIVIAAAVPELNAMFILWRSEFCTRGFSKCVVAIAGTQV